MARGKKLPQEVWAEIRARYERGDNVHEIWADYGVPESTFHWRRRYENWKRRDTVAAAQAVARAAKQPTAANITAAVDQLEARMEQHVLASGAPRPTTIAPAAPPARALPAEARRTLALVGLMVSKLQRLLQSPQLLEEGVSLRDRSKSLLDMTNALERLQKVERTALGLDQGPVTAGTVVIVVPRKESEEEWARKALHQHAIDVEPGD